MTADKEEWSELPMGATTETRTRSGTSVIRRSSVPPCAWVGPTTNWSQLDSYEVKGCNIMMMCGCRTQPLLMMAIDIAHKQESGTHILMLVNSQKSGYLGQGRGTDWTHEFCLVLQTLKTIISQQPHSNLGWWNAPYPSRTYTAIARARGISWDQQRRKAWCTSSCLSCNRPERNAGQQPAM